MQKLFDLVQIILLIYLTMYCNSISAKKITLR